MLLKRYDLRKENSDRLLQVLKKRSQLDNSDVNQKVSKVINDIREQGNSALLKYTKEFDGIELDCNRMVVSKKEIDSAYKMVDHALIRTIEKAIQNIQEFHEKQIEKSWVDYGEDGRTLGLLVRPIESIGIYVPGGSAPLISTVLMNIIPAKVAGVKRIAMATPPMPDGSVHPAILAAAHLSGVSEIYKMGGSQAVAALAFGTETVPKVDKIFGPGNIYVATAKRMVFGYCGIDSFAGPSEITVIADETACVSNVAADLLSQAEHDRLASSVLITTSEKIANEIDGELSLQLDRLSRKNIAVDSLENYGAVVVVDNLEDAADIANDIAPEHLELCIAEPYNMIGKIRHAGAVFLGNYSPEPLGDYFAGTNHVLPTSGTARFFSPLNVSDFCKKISLVGYSKSALCAVKDDIIRFADAEKLDAHANAIKIRF